MSETKSGGAGETPSRTEHTDRAAGAARAADDDWQEVQSVTAQKRSGSVVVPYRQPWAKWASIEQSVEVGVVAHTPTNAIVLTPPGVGLDDVLGSDR